MVHAWCSVWHMSMHRTEQQTYMSSRMAAKGVMIALAMLVVLTGTVSPLCCTTDINAKTACPSALHFAVRLKLKAKQQSAKSEITRQWYCRVTIHPMASGIKVLTMCFLHARQFLMPLTAAAQKARLRS